MYIVKQLKNNFCQLMYLGADKNGESFPSNKDKQPEQNKEKTTIVDYKNQEWYKKLSEHQKKDFDYKKQEWYGKLSTEQKKVFDGNINKLSAEQKNDFDGNILRKTYLEKRIAGLKAEADLKGLKIDLSSGIDKSKTLVDDKEEKLEISFEDRVDMINRDIEILEKDIYNYNLKLNRENLSDSFDTSNTYFKEKLADTLGEGKKSEYLNKLLGEKKDLSSITAGEAYTLRKEGFDLASIFLAGGGKIVSKNDMLTGHIFTVNFGNNKNIENIIGAGDLLPINKFDKVKINGVEGTRRFYPRPGYYSDSGKYLSIFHNYTIEIISKKEVSGDEIVKSDKAFKDRFDEIRGEELSSKFRDKLESAGSETTIKFEGMSESDMEYLKTYMSKYIPKDQSGNIDFDTEKGTVSTKNGENLSGFIKKALPKGPGYEKYRAIVEEVTSRYPEISADKLATLINHENRRWDPMAGAPGSSAYGLGQMIDSTWKTYGKGLDRNNPIDQLDATCRYLKDIMQRKKCSVEIAMAYYNTGEGILSLSGSKIVHISKINPAITKKIPGGLTNNAKTYLIGAVAYYNDISFDVASTKV